MIRSIQGRVLAGMVGGAAMLLIVFGLVVYGVIRHSLMNQFDASLISAVRMLAASAEREDEKLELGVDLEKIPEFQGKRAESYYEFWGADGQVLAKSQSLGPNDLPTLRGPVGEPEIRPFDLKPHLRVRAAGLAFRSERGGGQGDTARVAVVVVARDSHHVLEQLEWLRGLLAITTAGTIGLSLLAGALIVRQALKPLNVLAADIAAIHEDNLGTRIETADMPAEMIPVQRRLNDLLARLDASFKRERRFASDVAHELRTPLAGLRSTAEVTLNRPRAEQEYRSSLADCLDITKSMEALVNTLLHLARTEATATPFRRERVAVTGLVDTCWQSFAQRAGLRRLTFESTLPRDLTCSSDADGLTLVFSNLLDNAVEYTEEAGRIDVTGRSTGATVVIRVANTGCQLSAEQIGQVFDAFWRADASRTETGVHFGLGLALVRRTVLALGGTVTVSLEPGGVFAVHLVLPAMEGNKENPR